MTIHFGFLNYCNKFQITNFQWCSWSSNSKPKCTSEKMRWPITTKSKRHKPWSWLKLIHEWVNHFFKHMVCMFQNGNEKNILQHESTQKLHQRQIFSDSVEQNLTRPTQQELFETCLFEYYFLNTLPLLSHCRVLYHINLFLSIFFITLFTFLFFLIRLLCQITNLCL